MWSNHFLAIAILALNHPFLATAEPKCKKLINPDLDHPWTNQPMTTPTITTPSPSTTTTPAAEPTCTGVSTSACNTNRLERSYSTFIKLRAGCSVQNPSFTVRRVTVYDNTQTGVEDCDAVGRCADYANANQVTAFRVYLVPEENAWHCEIGDKGSANTVTEADEAVDRWYYYETDANGGQQQR